MTTTKMADAEAFPDGLKQNAVVRNCDVTELYMADRNLEILESLEKFKNLQRLWLNGNKLRKINFVQANFRLTELYLQGNLLVDITAGSLRHLAALEVLMLQGNQLKQLTDVVHELRKMQRLRVLNLFGNPLAQDYDYRNYVIHNIPSLELLDRQGFSLSGSLVLIDGTARKGLWLNVQGPIFFEILKKERDNAQKRYGDATAERIKETLAFGRRVPTSSTNDSEMISPREAAAVKSAHLENLHQGSSLDRQHTRTSKENSATKRTRLYLENNDESGSNTPSGTVQRSVMQYSTFDWSAVPLSEEKRLSGESKLPRIITMYLR